MEKETKKLTFTVQFVAKNYSSHRQLLCHSTLTHWISIALFADAQFTLRFVDEEEGHQLNYTYRKKNKATNVLTFIYSKGEEPVVADIVLCCPVIEQEAIEAGKTLVAHYAHMIIHGVLHAQGYDHQTKKETKQMEELEIKLMESLAFANPYQSTKKSPLLIIKNKTLQLK